MTRRPGSLLVFLSLLSASSVAHAQCNPDASGPCDEVHPEPGCVVTECCDAVCDSDPLCCDFEWDSLCIDAADSFCDGLACPGSQPCTDPSDVPGCSDQACCRLTCDHDWYCCYVEWDSYCIDLSRALCDRRSCILSVPPTALLEEEPCDERLNDGCNLLDPAYQEISCGDLVLGATTTSIPRDTDWYRLSLQRTTVLRVALESEFPAQVVVLTGPCTGPIEVHAILESVLCSGVNETILELPPGDWSLVVAPGREEISLRSGLQCPLDELEVDEEPEPVYFGSRYLLELQCSPDPCQATADLNRDGLVNGADLTLLLSSWGEVASADLDCDGVVNGADLTLLLSQWNG